jgi:hypothetical protein
VERRARARGLRWHHPGSGLRHLHLDDRTIREVLSFEITGSGYAHPNIGAAVAGLRRRAPQETPRARFDGGHSVGSALGQGIEGDYEAGISKGTPTRFPSGN